MHSVNIWWNHISFCVAWLNHMYMETHLINFYFIFYNILEGCSKFAWQQDGSTAIVWPAGSWVAIGAPGPSGLYGSCSGPAALLIPSLFRTSDIMLSFRKPSVKGFVGAGGSATATPQPASFLSPIHIQLNLFSFCCTSQLWKMKLLNKTVRLSGNYVL